MRHGILTGNLQSRAIDKIQHDRIRQLLAVEVGYIRHLELLQLILLRRAALDFRRLCDGEDDVAVGVDLYYAAFPELWVMVSCYLRVGEFCSFETCQ